MTAAVDGLTSSGLVTCPASQVYTVNTYVLHHSSLLVCCILSHSALKLYSVTIFDSAIRPTKSALH